MPVKNSGKLFEEDIKKSVPSEYWCYRLRDSSGAWNTGEENKTRFTPSNICDFIVMAKGTLFLLELKSYGDMSIPLTGIRKSQLEGMAKINYESVKPYFIFNFRKVEKVYAVAANKLKEFIETTERKSIPLKWCEENGVEIPGVKKKVRYRYDLTTLLEMQN